MKHSTWFTWILGDIFESVIFHFQRVCPWLKMEVRHFWKLSPKIQVSDILCYKTDFFFIVSKMIIKCLITCIVILLKIFHNCTEAKFPIIVIAGKATCGHSTWKEEQFVVMYCIVLYWRGGHCCPMRYNLFRSIVLPRIYILGHEYAN